MTDREQYEADERDMMDQNGEDALFVAKLAGVLMVGFIGGLLVFIAAA